MSKIDDIKLELDGLATQIADLEKKNTDYFNLMQSEIFNDSIKERLLTIALRYLGLRVPYRFGGNYTVTDKTFDCSKFMQTCYLTVGTSLPRTSLAQSKLGVEVFKSELIFGDLLFFDTNNDGIINHVGMYIGSSLMIHTATTAEGIQITDLNTDYISSYVKAIRILPWR